MSYIYEINGILHSGSTQPADGITFIKDPIYPEDRLFRGAWKMGVDKVQTDLPLAQEIAHDKRRIHRDNLFAPLDVLSTIPAQAVQAEADRQVIRNTDAQLQIDISNVVDEASLRALVVGL